MDHSYGFLSLLPPLIAIVLAIRTKQVYISLMFGIWLGWVAISDWNFWEGSMATLNGLVEVFKDPGNTRTIMFAALVGALIVFMQRSGGVAGFILWVNKRMEKYELQGEGKNRIMIQLMAWLTGFLVFVESSISVLTVGTLYRPLFDKLGIPREKLAYIADSSSAPSCIIIPFNAWGAFIMSLLVAQGFEDPFRMLLKSIPYNFYALFALFLVPVIILIKKDWGPMKRAEIRAREEGKVLGDNAKPMISEELTDIDPKDGVIPRARNMIMPILIMVLMMPIMLAITGWGAALELRPDHSFMSKLFFAIGQGSGSMAVLTAVVTSILFSMIGYRAQNIFRLDELMDLTMKGIGGLMPLALLMLMAFAIGNVCREMETGAYVAEITSSWLSPGLVPLIIFLVTCFIAFSTGTSWGTFAIMIAIAVPIAQQLDANVLMTIAAVLGGGVFGDHCSPISDTTILASMASASDHIDHVKTQLPYALFAGLLASLGYLILGII